MTNERVRIIGCKYYGECDEPSTDPKSKPWRHHAFTVTLGFEGRTLETPWKQGIGLGSKRPTAADVLDSLLSDASSAQETFADWCGEFGYSTDSRKALEMYLACQRIAADLRKLLGRSWALTTDRPTDEAAAELCGLSEASPT